MRFIDVAILWYSVKIMKWSFALFVIILLVLVGCRTEESSQPVSTETAEVPAVASVPVPIGCSGCHDKVQLDSHHAIACTSCHGGVDNESQLDKAHAGLIARPSHPQQMATTCGTCHQEQVADAAHSLHFTLENKVNTVRQHFGAEEHLDSPLDIPVATTFATPLDLADDMLRRRCLRCHVYSSGDLYPAVVRGTGCSACHLAFKNGKLQAHTFKTPTENQCLSCHYGNYVGSDYYGRYEHDYDWEYRTPFTANPSLLSRPYGIETHTLVADIHQQRGLTCIDCHQGSGHGRLSTPLTCASCHGWHPGESEVPALDTLRVQGNDLVLTARTTGNEHTVPSLRHPAHEQYGQLVACQVCHGQWSYNDSTTHLLLSESDDFEPWYRMTVQSSSEVEYLLEHNIFGAGPLLLPAMRDGLTRQARMGVWYQGFTQRRWEQMIVATDTDGVIKVFRPILDLRLSHLDGDGQVPFDNVVGKGTGLRPYTPHTTGPAGMFYLDRFQHLLTP